MGAFEAGSDRAEADVWGLGAICIDLKRRFKNWIASFFRSSGVLFMVFRASGTREACRQMSLHLAVFCNGLWGSEFTAASRALMAPAAHGAGLHTGRFR